MAWCGEGWSRVGWDGGEWSGELGAAAKKGVKLSLQTKRNFRRLFHMFESFFAFWSYKNWGDSKKLKEGGRGGTKGNACHKTQDFEKPICP